MVAPISQVRDFLKRRGLNFVAHILLAGAIFFGGIMSAPTSAPELPETEEPPSVTRSLPASADADAVEDETALQVEPEPDVDEEARLAAEEQARQEEEARRAAEAASRQTQIPKSSPANNFGTYDNAEQQRTTDTYVLNTST